MQTTIMRCAPSLHNGLIATPAARIMWTTFSTVLRSGAATGAGGRESLPLLQGRPDRRTDPTGLKIYDKLPATYFLDEILRIRASKGASYLDDEVLAGEAADRLV